MLGTEVLFFLEVLGSESVKGLILPLLETKTGNCFSQISFDWLIRRITEV